MHQVGLPTAPASPMSIPRPAGSDYGNTRYWTREPPRPWRSEHRVCATAGNAAKQTELEAPGASQAGGPSSLEVSEESSATTSLQAGKEDASNVQAPAAARKPGSKLESNPLAALNPK